MKKSLRLKKNSDFQSVYKKKKSFANRQFIIYLDQDIDRGHQFGLSISKKLGNAVMRNKIKRRVRVICQKLQHELKYGRYIIIARHPVINMTQQEMEKSLYHVFSVANSFKKEAKRTNKNKSG